MKKLTWEKINDFVCGRMKGFDALIVEDYGKGLFDHSLLSSVISQARLKGKIITVDPKEDNFESYRGVTCITPNRKEAQNAVRYLKMKDDQNSFRKRISSGSRAASLVTAAWRSLYLGPGDACASAVSRSACTGIMRLKPLTSNTSRTAGRSALSANEMPARCEARAASRNTRSPALETYSSAVQSMITAAGAVPPPASAPSTCC